MLEGVHVPVDIVHVLCYNQIETNLSIARLTHVVYAFLYECNYDITTEKKLGDILEVEVDATEVIPFTEIKLLEEKDYIDLNLKRGRGALLDDNEKSQLKKY